MQELEKILEEIETSAVYAETKDGYGAMCVSKGTVERIIRKYINDGWISVEERLPEAGEYVIGTNKYDEVLVYRYGWNSPHTKKMFFSLCGAAADITAWMPLPKPYKVN